MSEQAQRWGVLNRPHSCSWSAVHLNSPLSHNSSLKHTVFEDKFGMNFQMKSDHLLDAYPIHIWSIADVAGRLLSVFDPPIGSEQNVTA